jgi:hypothetical protein
VGLLALEQAVSSQRSAVSPVKAMHRSAAVDRVVRVQVKVGWVTIAPLSSWKLMADGSALRLSWG